MHGVTGVERVTEFLDIERLKEFILELDDNCEDGRGKGSEHGDTEISANTADGNGHGSGGGALRTLGGSILEICFSRTP